MPAGSNAVPGKQGFQRTDKPEGRVDLLEPQPLTDDAGLNAALAAYNSALGLEGMRIGPPSPRHREDLATFNASVEACTDAFGACAPADVDELFARAATAAAEDKIEDVTAYRARLADALDRSRKERTAAAAVDILRHATGDHSWGKRPPRRQLEQEVIEAIEQVDEAIELTREQLLTFDIVHHLPEPLRTRANVMPAQALQRWIVPAQQGG